MKKCWGLVVFACFLKTSDEVQSIQRSLNVKIAKSIMQSLESKPAVNLQGYQMNTSAEQLSDWAPQALLEAVNHYPIFKKKIK